MELEQRIAKYKKLQETLKKKHNIDLRGSKEITLRDIHEGNDTVTLKNFIDFPLKSRDVLEVTSFPGVPGVQCIIQYIYTCCGLATVGDLQTGGTKYVVPSLMFAIFMLEIMGKSMAVINLNKVAARNKALYYLRKVYKTEARMTTYVNKKSDRENYLITFKIK